MQRFFEECLCMCGLTEGFDRKVGSWCFFSPFTSIWISQERKFLRLLPQTFSSGCLGSHIDEERCELRYVMRIAGFSESSKFWTHIALSGYAWKYACISVHITNLPFFLERCRCWGVFLDQKIWNVPWKADDTRLSVHMLCVCTCLSVRSFFLWLGRCTSCFPRWVTQICSLHLRYVLLRLDTLAHEIV